MRSNDFEEIDITAANKASFDVKNCITSDGLTPASAAIRLIVVAAAKPSEANQALLHRGWPDASCSRPDAVRGAPRPGLGFRSHPKNLPRERLYEQLLI